MTEIAIRNSTLEQLESGILNECRIQANSFSETGKLLKAIKDGSKFSEKGFATFDEYMEDACGTLFPFRSRQARKYISIYEKYGPRLEQYSNISIEILDIFKNENPEDFEKLAEENDLEHMTVTEAKELKKQLAQANEQISFLTEQRDAAVSELEEQKSKPVDVAVVQPSEEQEKAIEERVKKTLTKEHNAEIKALKKEISDAEKVLKIERKNISEEYEKKLKELDEKLTAEKSAADERVKALEQQLESASGKADEERIEVKFYFLQIQEDFGKFTEVIKNISDAEKKAHYKESAVKFVDTIRRDLDGI